MLDNLETAHKSFNKDSTFLALVSLISKFKEELFLMSLS